MTVPDYRIARLTGDLDLVAFDCGAPEYTDWLVDHAHAAVAVGSSMVYLLLERVPPRAEERVVGYYAVCPTMVARDDVPRPLRRGLLRAVPAWLLDKLALDVSLRGDHDHQWGSQLLRAALETIVAGAERGGGQVIAVDAGHPGLVGWYVRHGFRSTDGPDLRLYLKVATARSYLAQG